MIIATVAALALIAPGQNAWLTSKAHTLNPHAQVACVTMSEQDGRWGEADIPGQIVRLAPTTCRILLHPARTQRYRDAVYVMAHELGHLAHRTWSERLADGYADRHVDGLLHELLDANTRS